MTCLDPKTIWPNEAVPNVRYRDFSKMVLFTAGDEDQFERKRSYKNGTNPDKKISLDGNVWTNLFVPTEGLETDSFWNGYNLNASSTINTFNYVFNKFKKGIFVKIVDNKVVTFLPFSKHGYKNDWGDLMKYDPSKYKSMIDFMRHVSNQTAIANNKNYKFKPDQVSRYTNQWYANNCLIRYEHPLSEGDTNVVTLRHMFDELCATREVPDIELFINRRDFPLLTKNGTEPYYNIFGKDHSLDSKSLKLISEGMCPILSMCTSDMYADIVIPTHEDWARVASIEGVKTHVNPDKSEANNENNLPKKITFPPQCKDYSKDNFSTPWEKRIPTAVFRGGSTGCGVSSNTNLETFNQRLVAATISYNSKPDKYNVPLINAGITKWNLRPRKILNEKYLQTINFEKEAPKVLPLTPEEQSKYKYIINIDGHVSAFRLSLEMSMGCCILLVKSKIPVESSLGWKMWFSHLLKPYVHYVPVKSDLSDLIEKIQWCRDNDEKCKEISIEALKFYQTYLTRESILDYMQNLMVKLKTSLSTNETVYGTDPLFIQNDIQSKYLFDMMNQSIKPTSQSHIPYLIPKPIPIYDVLNSERTVRGSYGWSKGYSMFLKHMFRPKNEKKPKGEEELNENDDLNMDEMRWETKHSTINLHGVFEKRLFENKKSTVDLYSISGSNVVKKSTSDPQGMIEHINEAFVSDTCINNLLKVIPNFAWSFAFEKSLSEEGKEQCTLLNEYIEGETLSMSIKNKMSYLGFSSGKPFKNVLEVLFQIILSIQFAQEQCGFIHNDLTPWNIIIQTLKEPITIQYPLFSGIYKIITKHVPVIIDYGKSHVATSPYGDFCLNEFGVGNVVHYGVVNMFNMIECQDVFSIIIYSCLDMLTVDKSEDYDEQSIIKMLNFFSSVELKTRKEALSFIYKYKKYENLIKAHETINLEKSPIEFIKYCASIFKKEKVAYGISRLDVTKKADERKLVMDFSNPKQIFDEAFAQNIHEVYLSFLNVPQNLYKCTLPQPNTKIELYMVAQLLIKYLKDTLKDYHIFVKNQNIRNELFRNGVIKFENAIGFITTFYSKEIAKHGNDSWVIPELCEKNQMEISRNYFRTKTLIHDIKPCTDLTFFKKTILNILNWTDQDGLFEIKGEDRKQILDQLKFVLESTFKDKQIAADNNTYLVYKNLI